MELSLTPAIGLFLAAAVVIVVAASFLTAAADTIASRMGLGRLWVGSLLLAGATSLPELVTAVAAAIGGSAELAAGNILGANMLNMSNLAILMALFGGREIFRQLAPQQTWVAGSAILLTAMATLFAVTQIDFKLLAVSIPAIAIIAVYVVISRILRQFSSEVEESEGADEEEPAHSLAWGWTVFLAAAAAIFVSGPALAISAEAIADATGIGSSFVGVLALAVVTTLPELTTTIAAFRMKAYDLGLANMYGTNSFNIVALAAADLAYTDGSLYSFTSAGTVAAGLFAVLLMSLGLVQLAMRRPLKQFSLLEPSPPLFVGIYLIGLAVVFQLA